MMQLGLPQLEPGSGTFECATFRSTAGLKAKAARGLLASALVMLTGIHACHANPETRGSLAAQPIPLAPTSSGPAQPLSLIHI